MGNKATQPRSFNTIRRSQSKVRAQRRKTQRIVLLAIFATVALILLSVLVLGGFLAVNAIIDARPPAPGTENPQTPSTNITFIQRIESAENIHKDPLILVNSDNRYLFPESAESSLVRIYDHRSKTEGGRYCYSLVDQQYKLQAEAVYALDAMMLKNYEVTGDIIRITDAYRTLAAQEKYDTPPGYSDHHTGYCFSIRYDDTGELIEADHWIYQNCHKYGFVVRYPEGKEDITGVSQYTYCLRYVGVAHATYMFQNNYCMEEYLDLLQNQHGPSQQRLSIVAADGFTYEVYYVPASGAELTTIEVPSNYSCTVSGDNRSGFIVTVKMTPPAA